MKDPYIEEVIKQFGDDRALELELAGVVDTRPLFTRYAHQIKAHYLAEGEKRGIEKMRDLQISTTNYKP